MEEVREKLVAGGPDSAPVSRLVYILFCVVILGLCCADVNCVCLRWLDAFLVVPLRVMLSASKLL